MGDFECVSLSMLPILRQERGKNVELNPYKIIDYKYSISPKRDISDEYVWTFSQLALSSFLFYAVIWETYCDSCENMCWYLFQ